MSPVEFILCLIGLVAFVLGYFVVGKIIDFFKKGSVLEEPSSPAYPMEGDESHEPIEAEYLPPPSMPAEDVRRRQEADYKAFLEEQKRRNK